MKKFEIVDVSLDYCYRTDQLVEAEDVEEAQSMLEDEIAHNVSVHVEVEEVIE